MRRACAGLLALVVFPLVACALEGTASAAPPWVDRRMTPLSGQWLFDVGGGVAHAPVDSGAGINLEMGVGLTDRVELGVRTGIRLGGPVDRSLEPDSYGRLFDRQYFGGDGGAVANPELRIRWAFLGGSVAEVGLEGRFIVPLEDNTYAGFEPGLPVALHLGERVRLDTGFFLPVVAAPQAVVGVGIPVDIWIQVTPRLWLGPMTGLQSVNVNGNRNNNGNQANTWMSMGFGLGCQITRYLDFKSMFLFPELSNDSRVYGFGAGVQIRIE